MKKRNHRYLHQQVYRVSHLIHHVGQAVFGDTPFLVSEIFFSFECLRRNSYILELLQEMLCGTL